MKELYSSHDRHATGTGRRPTDRAGAANDSTINAEVDAVDARGRRRPARRLLPDGARPRRGGPRRRGEEHRLPQRRRARGHGRQGRTARSPAARSIERYLFGDKDARLKGLAETRPVQAPRRSPDRLRARSSRRPRRRTSARSGAPTTSSARCGSPARRSRTRRAATIRTRTARSCCSTSTASAAACSATSPRRSSARSSRRSSTTRSRARRSSTARSAAAARRSRWAAAMPRTRSSERDELVNVLKTGSLPAPLREEAEQKVGPTLGRDAIDKTKLSFIDRHRASSSSSWSASTAGRAGSRCSPSCSTS